MNLGQPHYKGETHSHCGYGAFPAGVGMFCNKCGYWRPFSLSERIGNYLSRRFQHMEDKIKRVIAAGIALGVVSIPGFSDAITAAGGEQAILAAFAAVWEVAHGITNWVHARTTP